MKLFLPKDFINKNEVVSNKNTNENKDITLKESNEIMESNKEITPSNLDLATTLLFKSKLGYFLQEQITDLSYNGSNFFIQSNVGGRQKIEVDMDSNSVFDLIRQIANVTGKVFSIASPILNVSFGQYRLSAIHPSLAKKDLKGVITFSLRHLSPVILLNSDTPLFAPKYVHNLLRALIEKRNSIIISGVTGSGKTEFQKYLVSFIPDNSKIILIEDTYETFIKELYPNLDVNVWLSEEGNCKKNLSDLIKVALRNNPDWILVAEVRGEEAYEVVESSSTGHPLLTTLHSDSAKESLNRLMILINRHYETDNKTLSKKLANSIKIAVHLDKVEDLKTKKYIRYIKEIVEYGFDDELRINLIYEAEIVNGKLKRINRPISLELSKEIGVGINWFNSRKEI